MDIGFLLKLSAEVTEEDVIGSFNGKYLSERLRELDGECDDDDDNDEGDRDEFYDGDCVEFHDDDDGVYYDDEWRWGCGSEAEIKYLEQPSNLLLRHRLHSNHHRHGLSSL